MSYYFCIISVVKAIIKAKEEKEPDENVFDTEVSEAKAEEPAEESESTEVVIVNEENE